MQEAEFRDVGLVVAAAGSSSRFGAENKLLAVLDGRPVLVHCIERFLRVIRPSLTVLVAPPGDEESFRQVLAAHGITSNLTVISGGGSRQESVFAGIQSLPAGATIVAIQDAARPYSSLELLHACVVSARERGSGVAARLVTDTIKFAAPDGRVESTPDRGRLLAAETPQVFRRDLIEPAYRALAAADRTVTDDAQALELADCPVFLVPHDQVNDKITFRGDLP